MLWFLVAAAGSFYAFWKSTAPLESEVRKRQALEVAERDADARAAALPAPDQPEDTLRGEAPVVEVVDSGSPPPDGVEPYDPANNPFRAQDPTPEPENGMNGEEFKGSYDDFPEDAPDLDELINADEDGEEEN